MEEDLFRERRKKLEELREMGINPFAGKFLPEHKIADVIQKYGEKQFAEGEESREEISLAGRVMAVRGHGKAAFCHIQDRSGKIQIYVRLDVIGEEGFGIYKKTDIGDFVGVSGPAFKTRTGELTVKVKNLTLLAKSLRPLPEKWHGLKDVDTRFRQRYVDLIVNPEVRETFKIRARTIGGIREFLNGRDYVEVETPMLQPIAGGAAATPFKTFHEALGIDLYLRIAPELYLKRLIAAGMERVYELNRSFRNEGISTRHNPEFTMLEAYTAYADYNDVMKLTEELITCLAKQVLARDTVTYGENQINLAAPWKRISYYGSLKESTGKDLSSVDENEARQVAAELNVNVEKCKGVHAVVDQIFEKAVEPKLIQPTFVIDYPTATSPLAKSKPDDPELAERFELFVGGMELANAFSELNDPDEQRRRFEKQGGQIDEDFLRALEQGMPPAGGLGIGIDRLTMIFTDNPSIREVILFPQLRPEK